jgi:hypothetical protein
MSIVLGFFFFLTNSKVTIGPGNNADSLAWFKVSFYFGLVSLLFQKILKEFGAS